MKSRPNKNKNYNTNVRYSNEYLHLVVSFHGIIQYSFFTFILLLSSIGPFFSFFFWVFSFVVFLCFCVFILRSRMQIIEGWWMARAMGSLSSLRQWMSICGT